jgi:uncharacterized membrane protein
MVRWIAADPHRRCVISFLAAFIAFWCLRDRLGLAANIIAAWDTFAVFVLALAWFAIFITPQPELRNHAKTQDFSRFLIFVFVVAASCVALFTVAFLIRTHREEMRAGLTSPLLLALGTVACSWLLLHTVFSLHYAHVFYGDDEIPGGHGHAGGLKFPGRNAPDYLDFAYFSFVVGMTCQVSDVQVESRTMRKMALLHGILSFGYNTIILALLINTVSGLL